MIRKEKNEMQYDVLIIGAGPGGIFTAWELAQKAKRPLKAAVLELGKPLEKRKCPIDGKKVKSCIKCPVCAIMSGFGGAGAFSDGKYNITNAFGGTLYEKIGKQQATELMWYVDGINMSHGGEGTKLYRAVNQDIKKKCLQNGLPLDQDVYDLASWCSLGELTERSVRGGSAPQRIPDFTRGAWERRAALGIESIDPGRMDLAGIRPMDAK